MQLIENVETVTYLYDSSKEYYKHKEEMLNSGWEFKSCSLDNQHRICVSYSMTVMSKIETVKKAIDKSRATTVVIKSYGKVVFNDTLDFLKQGSRISDRSLYNKIVTSKNESNGILTLVVQ